MSDHILPSYKTASLVIELLKTFHFRME